MNWRDLLYFSKGERRAFALILCLIAISWGLLLRTDYKRRNVVPEADTVQVEKQSFPEEKRIIIGENTSEKKNISARKEAQFRSDGNGKSFGKRNTAFPDRPYTAGKKRRKEHNVFPQTEKYPTGTLVELNSADTTILKKVPGIGSTFARRIVKYRELLGGFHHVGQLAEVYGIDEERYSALAPWFVVDTLRIRKLNVNTLPAGELRRHPYLDYRQAKAIEQLRRQKGRLAGWENLRLLEEFTDTDKERLIPYLSFE